ncbi:hypothetical protein STEG23_023410, partial [Scotinomys teguina]
TLLDVHQPCCDLNRKILQHALEATKRSTKRISLKKLHNLSLFVMVTDCSLKIRELDVPAPWFLDPGGWSKTAMVSLYFIFPGICTLSLNVKDHRNDAMLKSVLTEGLEEELATLVKWSKTAAASFPMDAFMITLRIIIEKRKRTSLQKYELSVQAGSCFSLSLSIPILDCHHTWCCCGIPSDFYCATQT